MKPLNQKEINEKFFNFMILFIVCVAVFAFALYYDFNIPGSELRRLREQNNNYANTFNRYDERFTIAKDMNEKLNLIWEKGISFKPGDKDTKGQALNKMYNEVEDDSTNDVLQIFRITRGIMINEMTMIDSLTARDARLKRYSEMNSQLKTDLETCNSDLDKATRTLNNQR